MAPPRETTKSREYIMRKYLLLLATLVATVTYSVGFNPPGGVWQDTNTGHLAGDPINRDTHHLQYAVFFYCNATAFASSLVIVVLILLLAVLHELKDKDTILPLHSLRVVMVLDLLSLMGAYGAGTCWDALTAIYSLLLAAAIFIYLMVQMVLASLLGSNRGNHDGEKNDENNRDRELKKNDWPRKVLMLLATFTTSITYVIGLNTPGGFWDSTQDGHHAGDAVLQEHHPCRHMVFFICNTTAFGASLLIIVLLLNSKLRHHITSQYYKLYGCTIMVAMIGLVGAYAAGSSRETDTTIYVGALVGAVLVCILFQVAIIKCFKETEEQTSPSSATQNNGGQKASQLDEARSLVLLLATLAATVTYQAGLDPPGGCWLDDGDGYKAGDPILLTKNPRRYKVFFICNSTSFVASLFAIILVQKIYVLEGHTLEAAMILDLFGLIGAYAAGSCRDVSISIYVMALAGVVLVYVVIHIVFATLDDKDSSKSPDELKLMEKRRKRLLLFAILGATITYQAGLTPPSGFWLEDDHNGHHAGDPILFYSYPRRYKAFFYCNSVSFMSSIALIILLVNPNLYRPAIRSYALSVCTVAGMSALMGAFAAGSSQHMRTSIYVFVLVAVVLAFVIPLFIIVRKPGEQPPEEQGGDRETGDQPQNEQGGDGNTGGHPPVEQGGATITGEKPPEKQGGDGDPERKQYTKRKYLMVLGILAASVTYQAGLDPPGGVWQGNSGLATGGPILHDKRRHRYRAFFYCNSTSFVASIVVIVLLLLEKLLEKLQEDTSSKKPQEDPISKEEPQEDPISKKKPQENTISKEEPQEDPNSKKPQEDQWLLKAMNTTIVLDMLGLLGAYEAGSSRGEGETFWYVIALIITVLGYLAIYVVMSLFNNKPKNEVKEPNETPSAHPMLTPGPLQV